MDKEMRHINLAGDAETSFVYCALGLRQTERVKADRGRVIFT